MSATGRGATRQPLDAYATPHWCVRRLLEACPLPDGRWLEPACGDGAIVQAVDEFAPSVARRWGILDIVPGAADAVADATPRVMSYGARDYRSIDWSSVMAPGAAYDVAITNPPFVPAFEFAKKMRRDALHVALLLRLNWLGSGVRSGRSQWLRDNPPDVYVLPNRPEFVASLKCVGHLPTPLRDVVPGCGWRATLAIHEPRPHACSQCGGRVQVSTTDATEYAWLVWPPGDRTSGRLQVLNETPEEERRQ